MTDVLLSLLDPAWESSKHIPRLFELQPTSTRLVAMRRFVHGTWMQLPYWGMLNLSFVHYISNVQSSLKSHDPIGQNNKSNHQIQYRNLKLLVQCSHARVYKDTPRQSAFNHTCYLIAHHLPKLGICNIGRQRAGTRGGLTSRAARA